MRIELCTCMRPASLLLGSISLAVCPIGCPPDIIGGICTDSREVRPGDLFIAIRGECHDGHSYISQAISKGAAAIAVRPGTETPPGNYYKCEIFSAENALLDAAGARRQLCGGTRVIAVSGSTGKTTVKEAIAAVLSERYTVRKNAGNYNSTLGMPLSMLSMEDAKFFVCEFGINHPGEMVRLSSAVSPDQTVLTNIGTAHVGNFDGPKALAKEKMSITVGQRENGILFCPEELPDMLLADHSLRICRVGTGEHADVRGIDIRQNAKGVYLNIATADTVIENCFWPIPGRMGVSVLLIAAAVGLQNGLSGEEIRRGIEKAGQVTPRMLKIRVGERLLIDDTYNASPEAVTAAIETLILVSGRRPCFAVLGDMLELGNYSASLHEAVGEYAARAGLGGLFLCGEYARYMAKGAIEAGFPQGLLYVSDDGDPQNLSSSILKNTPRNSVILLKASHKSGLERVVDAIRRMS